MEQEKTQVTSAVTDAEIVWEIVKSYPYFNEYLYGKAKNPMLSGIELTAGARAIEHDVIYGKSNQGKPKRIERADRKKCTIRLPISLIMRLNRMAEVFGVEDLNKIVNMVLSYGLEMLEVEHDQAVG